ncbi:DODA-type extradiol aromatic ring-opening family dioxygenase [Paenibacillus mendelii]|uniref:DODA-type extradiol aromatic ring-opening family dioxygenase n=1 Tax=Paenibacillus mendelii TaxID=206163 RepID=A0ABV6JBE8_9BACL|nr:class III extradiol ring-cleavage dioxygenase [Paenibacillus mendelii]MCQ6560825.1 dioxygenase [Paenibacillus mendelii]
MHTLMPALFIAHGEPSLAIERSGYTNKLQEMTEQWPKPTAIVVFSAHWDHRGEQLIDGGPQGNGGSAYSGSMEQPGVRVTNKDNKLHRTLHDFKGFQEELYRLTYPVHGSSIVATRILKLLRDIGTPCGMKPGRGLDHGVWAPLIHMYPDASIPVIGLSVDPSLQPSRQYAIGRALSALRQDGVLIIGSGGTVHNQSRIDLNADEETAWAQQFDAWIAEQLVIWNTDNLFAYAELAPHAIDAVPPGGSEHLAPLFYAMGAGDEGRQAERLFQGYQYGSLSLNVWQFM